MFPLCFLKYYSSTRPSRQNSFCTFCIFFSATSADSLGEDGAACGHRCQQPVPRLPSPHGEDADAQEPQERRDLLREDAETEEGPLPRRHAPGASQAAGEAQAGVREPDDRGLREAVSDARLQRRSGVGGFCPEVLSAGVHADIP